jgi:hypothetical protein
MDIIDRYIKPNILKKSLNEKEGFKVNINNGLNKSPIKEKPVIKILKITTDHKPVVFSSLGL